MIKQTNKQTNQILTEKNICPGSQNTKSEPFSVKEISEQKFKNQIPLKVIRASILSYTNDK